MSLSLHTALISTMVMVSASDGDMNDSEFKTIGQIVKSLPIFVEYDEEHLPTDAQSSMELLGGNSELAAIVAKIRAVLPRKLYDTAYALACDVAVCDGQLSQEELRMLEILRHGLDVDRLTAAAIERGSATRFARL